MSAGSWGEELQPAFQPVQPLADVKHTPIEVDVLDVPCVIALPVVAGNPAYLDWVISETSEATAASAADRFAS